MLIDGVPHLKCVKCDIHQYNTLVIKVVIVSNSVLSYTRVSYCREQFSILYTIFCRIIPLYLNDNACTIISSIECINYITGNISCYRHIYVW